MAFPGTVTLRIDVLTPDQAGFADACGKVAQLFARREAEFGFNLEIDRPAISIEAFLADAPGTLAPALAGDGPVTILTTWSDTLAPILCERGFAFRPITWPAGPENSGVFRREGKGRERYIELVNEEAPEIAPAHVLIAQDASGLVGGTITSLRNNAAWLAVMCVRPDMPAGTGSRLWDELVRALRGRGIARIDLGTQTAERFYLRCGMAVTDRTVARLRWRSVRDERVWSDLVMMTMDL